MNDMESTMDWLISWFQKNTNLERSEIEEKTRESYFERGWIDSFNFIMLVTDIESEFGITFSNEDLHDRAFSTIEGLSDIITRRMGEKNPETHR